MTSHATLVLNQELVSSRKVELLKEFFELKAVFAAKANTMPYSAWRYYMQTLLAKLNELEQPAEQQYITVDDLDTINKILRAATELADNIHEYNNEPEKILRTIIDYQTTVNNCIKAPPETAAPVSPSVRPQPPSANSTYNEIISAARTIAIGALAGGVIALVIAGCASGWALTIPVALSALAAGMFVGGYFGLRASILEPSLVGDMKSFGFFRKCQKNTPQPAHAADEQPIKRCSL